jgi:hypothetical protein
MSFLASIKRLFSQSESTSALLLHQQFDTAGVNFDKAVEGIDEYTNRANHRYTIQAAEYKLLRAPLGDTSVIDEYDQIVAEFPDPADFAPYTTDYLNQHSLAIEKLALTFAIVRSSFAALPRGSRLHPVAAQLFEARASLYVFSVKAYSRAAYCAVKASLEAKLKSTQVEWKAVLSEASANSGRAEASEALLLRERSNETAETAKVLEAAAKAAEERSKILLIDSEIDHEDE